MHNPRRRPASASARANAALRDPAPHVPAAGRRPGTSSENARHALQPDFFAPAPSTPRDEQRFRKGSIGVGESRSRGSAPPPGAQSVRHGRPSAQRCESVGAVMQVPNGRVVEMREAVYDSNKREPLGRPYVRGHEMPERVQNDKEFRFGRSSGLHQDAWAQQGKEVISPNDGVPDNYEVHEQYVRSHAAYAPGERADRRYAWPTEVANPEHRFGRPEGDSRMTGESVRSALGGGAPEISEAGKAGADPATKIVLASGEAFRRCIYHPVGHRPVGVHGQPPVPKGFSYGAPSVKTKPGDGDVSAGSVIRGSYTVDEQLPDKDLGRCIREGRRNITNENRPFGKPSRGGPPCPMPQGPSIFRPAPRGRVPDNDPDGQGLVLAPDRFNGKGVTSGDFAELRSRDEVRSLMMGAGYQLTDDEFDRLWNHAVAQGKSDQPVWLREASLDAVVKAYAGGYTKLVQ